ncbi:hypothetical protein [Sulfitobacter geojensis]
MGETQQVLRYPCHPHTKKLLSAAPSPLPRKPDGAYLQVSQSGVLVN